MGSLGKRKKKIINYEQKNNSSCITCLSECSHLLALLASLHAQQEELVYPEFGMKYSNQMCQIGISVMRRARAAQKEMINFDWPMIMIGLDV